MTNVVIATSVAALQALPTTADAVTFLSAVGREGDFAWRTGNFSAAVSSDPNQGLYIASSVTPASSGAWVRCWDGTHGRPEWFGAQTGNVAFDCVASFNACLALCPIMQLSAADYFIQDTWKNLPSRRTIVGAGTAYDTPGKCTRIVLTGSRVVSSTIVQTGPDTLPAQPSTYRLIMRDLVLQRDLAAFVPTPPSSGDPINAAKAMVANSLLNCRFENVVSVDNPVGFHIFGAVNTDFVDCQSSRNQTSTNPNDVTCGFLAGGTAALFGYAGANASLRISRCNVSGAGQKTIGMELFGFFVDTFVEDFEMAQMQYGIILDGQSIASSTAQADVHISHPVLDTVSIAGISIKNLNASASIGVIDPYIAPISGGAGIDLSGSQGAIRVTGGQILCGDQTYGLHALNSQGFRVEATELRDGKFPVLATNCSKFKIDFTIANYNQSAVTNPGNGTGIVLYNCSRGRVSGEIYGTVGNLSQGVFLDAACKHIEVDGSAIDYSSFITATQSAAYKVRFDNRDARGDSVFLANGNVLIGVTG